MVGCRGKVQLRVPAPRCAQWVPAKVGASKFILFAESSRVGKIYMRIFALNATVSLYEKVTPQPLWS